jgi:hypothetical protein
MDRIMALRDQAMEAGLANNNGARHASGFTEIVGHSGWLDELQLTIKTVGASNIPALMGFATVGLRALTRGKLPPVIHKNIENVDIVRKLVRKLESQDPD